MTAPAGVFSRSLAEQTAGRTEGPTDLRMGTVKAVTAFGITVDVGGGTVTASHLDSYAPAVGHTVALVRVMDAWVCLGRPVGSGTATDGATPGSGMGSTTLGGKTFTGSGAMASSTGAEVPVPGMSMSFHHPAGHNVLLMAGFNWTATNNADWIVTRWRESTTGLQVGEWVAPIVNAAFAQLGQHMALVPGAFGGANRTYYFNFGRPAGSGTVSITRVTTNPSFIFALDLGDATLVKVA